MRPTFALITLIFRWWFSVFASAHFSVRWQIRFTVKNYSAIYYTFLLYRYLLHIFGKICYSFYPHYASCPGFPYDYPTSFVWHQPTRQHHFALSEDPPLSTEEHKTSFVHNIASEHDLQLFTLNPTRLNQVAFEVAQLSSYKSPYFVVL